MRTAFKEWAVIVEGLGEGEQIVILRKGGIAEGRGGFQVEHERFLLFPTRFHQQREQVTPAGQARFDAGAPHWPPADRVRLDYVATVVAWRKMASLDEALRLRGHHLWRDEVIADRFEWGREQAIFVLALRVARLPEPIELPNLPAYGGCKTWLELATDVPVGDAIPVLTDDAFTTRWQALEALLVR
jgi:hypothetical protein